MKSGFERIPDSVFLYQEGDLGDIQLSVQGQFIQEKTGIPFHIGGNLYEECSKEKIEEAADAFSRIRVKDPGRPFTPGSPKQAELDYEKRRVSDPRWKIFGILYEGVHYQRMISRLISGGGVAFDHCSVLITNQLFGTWDPDDHRYHARVSLYGFPNLISLTGMVEAPAKPKGYYLKRQIGVPIELLKEEYQGQFLDHGDRRTAEVLKGYILQALFFHLTGDPFCEDRDCRLFNSHWQAEVLHSQLDGRYEFCLRHEAILKAIKDRLK